MTAMDGDRRRSYSAGAGVTRDRIRREAPLDAAALERVEASDVVVAGGTYDHVEWVLEALELPHTVVGPADVERLRLRPEQLLVVNCPGNVGRGGVEAVRAFVEGGGSLFTTDWALRNVLEPAFPGVVSYNGRATRDEVVRIEIADHSNPFLTGVIDPDDDPLWWLEGSSYPIRIDDPARVDVLIRSAELAGRHGEAPVAVVFRHGEGEVFHMISHYYLQRTELRTARHRGNAAAWAEAKGVVADPALARDLAGMTVGEVESAASSARMLSNVIAAKKRRTPQR